MSEPTNVDLTLYTDALVIRGSIRTHHRRVTDILNQAEQPYLVLQGVTVERHGANEPGVHSEFAQVNLESTLFAVADDAIELRPELRQPKTQQSALISIPPFEIAGTIHLLPIGEDLGEALRELTGSFLPVTHAEFWSDALAQPRRSARLLAVNHRRAQILAPFQPPG